MQLVVAIFRYIFENAAFVSECNLHSHFLQFTFLLFKEYHFGYVNYIHFTDCYNVLNNNQIYFCYVFVSLSILRRPTIRANVAYDFRC